MRVRVVHVEWHRRAADLVSVGVEDGPPVPRRRRRLRSPVPHLPAAGPCPYPPEYEPCSLVQLNLSHFVSDPKALKLITLSQPKRWYAYLVTYLSNGGFPEHYTVFLLCVKSCCSHSSEVEQKRGGL